MSELEIQALEKSFGDTCIVNHVSFHVKAGEFFVVLGPSGGGKTTLLRLICGLERPDGGRVMLGRKDITEMTLRQRNIGMVFQDYGLYPAMDVYGNIAYGLEVRGVRPSEIKRRIRIAAEMLGLSALIRRSPEHLSGGEQQRVALARVLVKDADIYLYDEPLSNLDPKLRYQARHDIMTIHRHKQKPSIYVTHDQTEAIAMADRIAIMAEGQLQQIGTPDELLQTPANLFTARFFGTPPMNIFPVHIEQSDGQFFVRHNTLSLPLPVRWTRYFKNMTQAEAIAGIRPEAIIPEWQYRRTNHSSLTIVEAEIARVTPLINEVVMMLKLADDIEVTSLYTQDENQLPKKGQVIKVGIDQNPICLFDPATEQAFKGTIV